MNNSVSASDLLAPWLNSLPQSYAALAIFRLELDSRNIKPGDTFVAVVGHEVDGRHYIENAIKQGANLVIAQADEGLPHGLIENNSGVEIVYIERLNQILSPLAGRLYRHSTNKLIGITGTNGKTTISQLIAQWLELIGKRSAVMGTTGNGFLEQLVEAKNTTGSAIDIQRTLSELSSQGAEYTALEVSSHGLVQGRVSDLNFEAAVFTNLSRDHLDYHGTMEAYALAKKSLFTQHNVKHAVINVDDPVAKHWVDELPNAISVSIMQQPDSFEAVWAKGVRYSEQGIEIAFSGKWGEGQLNAGLIGEFNANNLLVAFATLLSLGIEKSKLLQVSHKLIPVIGRMELFQADNKAKVVVDYAHTPDALEKALLALRVHCDGKLWAIFGCGGARDKGKRPMMASIGEQLADNVILTDDNPRNEEPSDIIADMLAGTHTPENIHVHHHRYTALEFALSQSNPNDIILLAGKGHEDYQVFASETVHFSDRESAQTLLGIE
ncbi:UDP-N-acetylmuramoyl-L-alanyl-D-glutamate--2,6-diaminopimelate ligase [Vibrio sp. RC27]